MGYVCYLSIFHGATLQLFRHADNPHLLGINGTFDLFCLFLRPTTSLTSFIQLHKGGFYKLALSDFVALFEVIVSVSEGV